MASETPSTKPYLIRALHHWCTDFGFTPFLAVFVDERVEVPELVRRGALHADRVGAAGSDAGDLDVEDVGAVADHERHRRRQAVAGRDRDEVAGTDLRLPRFAGENFFGQRHAHGGRFKTE